MADDKSLDLTSDEFDAFKALYSRNVTLPSPQAPVLDNITKFCESSEGISIRKPIIKAKVLKDSAQPSTSTDKASTPSGRGSRFQRHQGLVPGRAKRAVRNVLTRMNNAEGPLAFLQKCMNDRVRIKVLTRNMAGVRGHCVGYLLAFDKHYNMVLEAVTEVLTRNMAGVRGHCVGYLLAFDKHYNMALEAVTEVWTRKKRTKIPPLGPDEDIPVPIPKVRVVSSTAKTETCERHIPKLLMRGEHVVLVIAVDS